MDFWWIDGWIKSPFGNMDGQLWANRQYYEVAEEWTGKRGLILSRWGGLGSHRYPVQFSGDTLSDWPTLKRQIMFTADSGNLGAAYWSHDIGGFFNKEIDDELFIRWSQFGSLSPVFRTHSHHGIREPWKFGSRAKRVFKKQTRMRYALAPYLYTLAREAHDCGLPLARPMYLEYPTDKVAPGFRYQYLLGKDLLVIPADGPSEGKTGISRKRAYFPPGDRWLALETSDIVEPQQVLNLRIPLERIPVYVREGAILPSQPVGEAIGVEVPEELHLDCFPGVDGASEYELYEDDGESRGYEKKGFAKTRVKVSRSFEKIDVAIARPRGSYEGMPEQRDYVVRIRLQPEEEVASAEVKKGSEPWADAKRKTVSKVLASGLASGHRFCQVKASASKDESLKLRLKLR
jgi:alpha-glucosidase (family GH31 glycosyl hydrolase)